MSRSKILRQISDERDRQNQKWGENAQDHLKNGTGIAELRGLLISLIVPGKSPSEMAKAHCDDGTTNGYVDFTDILLEEVCEALEETNPVALRMELVQVAAVCVKWIEKLDRVDIAPPKDGGESACSPLFMKHFGPLVAAPEGERCNHRSGGARCVRPKGLHPDRNHRSASAIWAQDEEAR